MTFDNREIMVLARIDFANEFREKQLEPIFSLIKDSRG